MSSQASGPLQDRKEIIEEIADRAGDATAPPPPPPGGIPKRWVPGFIRWPLKILVYPFMRLDLAMQYLARLVVRPPWKTVGSCKQRGNCCHYIALPLHRGWKRPLAFLQLWWNTQINGFFVRDKDVRDAEGNRMVLLGCRYLLKDGRCKHYRLRPACCRQWPMIEIFGIPRRLKGCGYRAELRNKPKDPKDKLRIIK